MKTTKQYNVLIIEDSKIDQFITTHFLEKMANVSEINIANNGQEGIKWIYNHKKDISGFLIILLDINMPIMNGLQFLTEYHKLKDDLKSKTEIFILSTSLIESEIENLKNNIYVSDFLNKPISLDELSKKISKR